MKCPRGYVDRLAAELEAKTIERISRGRQEPKPYRCHRCKMWHLENGK